MRNLQKAIAGAVLLLGVSGMAQAQTAPANMGVSLVVANECTLATAPLAFLDSGIIVGALAARADITVQCTPGTEYEIGLGVGLGADATAENRVMTSGTDLANYMIYQDELLTLPWGNVLGTRVANVATGAFEEIPAFGSVFAGQNLPAGTYTDTVIATITY